MQINALFHQMIGSSLTIDRDFSDMIADLFTETVAYYFSENPDGTLVLPMLQLTCSTQGSGEAANINIVGTITDQFIKAVNGDEILVLDDTTPEFMTMLSKMLSGEIKSQRNPKHMPISPSETLIKIVVYELATAIADLGSQYAEEGEEFTVEIDSFGIFYFNKKDKDIKVRFEGSKGIKRLNKDDSARSDD